MHSKLAPSASARWINCPGSVALCKDIPGTNSVYAEEGTEAHAYAAWLLNGAQPPVPKASEEMVSFVSVYTGAIRRAAEGKLLLVEQCLDISNWTTETGGRGTADAIIVDADFRSIEVHDLKYGQGHIVEARNNEQLMLYALGALDLVEMLYGFEVNSVKLVIHQPRRDHLSEWEITRPTLVRFGSEAQYAGELALSGKGQLNPSEKACLWCPAKATCPALRQQVHNAVLSEFDDCEIETGLPSPEMFDLVSVWLKSIETAIFEKLQRFEPVPGWKLVLGRPGNRAWADPAEVEQLCKKLRLKKAVAYESKLKSPAQLEKETAVKIKWDAFEPLISRSDAKPTMVAATDPRPALEPAKTDEFESFI